MANNTKNSNMVVGLDIGTSKVVCIVGKYNESNKLEIISLGSYPSSGLKKGVVVNIDATTDAIKKAVEQAQSMIEERINSVYVGIAGNHIKSRAGVELLGPLRRGERVHPASLERIVLHGVGAERRDQLLHGGGELDRSRRDHERLRLQLCGEQRPGPRGERPPVELVRLLSDVPDPGCGCKPGGEPGQPLPWRIDRPLRRRWPDPELGCDG